MNNVKEKIREKYDLIAKQNKKDKTASCCCHEENEIDYSVFNDDYSAVEGYVPDADLSLGCGLPTELAEIRPGDHVLDLGSGAGNDCFVARSIVGESGRVTGLDFAENMIGKAKENAAKLGFRNVDFIYGDIESMPFPEEYADVVISNCVLNLVPDKRKAFAEIFRVLKKTGHFCVSDVVEYGSMPEKLKVDAEDYAGCVAGSIPLDEYLEIIQQEGFQKIEVRKKKKIMLPPEIVRKYYPAGEYDEFMKGGSGIFSVTVFARKG